MKLKKIFGLFFITPLLFNCVGFHRPKNHLTTSLSKYTKNYDAGNLDETKLKKFDKESDIICGYWQVLFKYYDEGYNDVSEYYPYEQWNLKFFITRNQFADKNVSDWYPLFVPNKPLIKNSLNYFKTSFNQLFSQEYQKKHLFVWLFEMSGHIILPSIDSVTIKNKNEIFLNLAYWKENPDDGGPKMSQPVVTDIFSLIVMPKEWFNNPQEIDNSKISLKRIRDKDYKAYRKTNPYGSLFNFVQD